MAETGSKIFDLDALVAIADDDVIVEVDVSDTTDSVDGTNKKSTVRDLLAKTDSGWIPVSDTWAYLSNRTITVPTGAGDIYQEGQKFKLTANSVVLQGYIVGIADTVLTVVGDALTNHTFTDNYYSIVANPLDFPEFFSLTTPVFTTSSAAFTNQPSCIAKFKIEGKMCYLYISGSAHATSGGTGKFFLTFTTGELPIEWEGYCTGTCLNATTSSPGIILFQDGVGYVNMFNMAGTTLFTNSQYFGANGQYPYAT